MSQVGEPRTDQEADRDGAYHEHGLERERHLAEELKLEPGTPVSRTLDAASG